MLTETKVKEEKKGKKETKELKSWVIVRNDNPLIDNAYTELETAKEFLDRLHKEEAELEKKIKALKKIAEGHSASFWLHFEEKFGVDCNMKVSESDENKIVVSEFECESCNDCEDKKTGKDFADLLKKAFGL